MTGLIKSRRRAPVRPLAAAATAALALSLAGCMGGNTYGTGKSPGLQTLEDLTGVATVGGQDKAPIDYTPRPKIVAPPSVAALPPPETTDPKITAANWPNDPDALRAKVKADAEARAAAGQQNTIKLPEDMLSGAPPTQNTNLSKAQVADLRKSMAAAKGGLAVDANGNPVRQYLSDPPAEYRLPDPNAPIAVADDGKPKKKKFKWWWQKD